MSLLDKHEVQDICGHIALRAKNGADFIKYYVNERQKNRHYSARSAEEKEKKKKKEEKKNAKS